MIVVEALIISVTATVLGIARRVRRRQGHHRAVQRRRRRLPGHAARAPSPARSSSRSSSASASRCCRCSCRRGGRRRSHRSRRCAPSSGSPRSAPAAASSSAPIVTVVGRGAVRDRAVPEPGRHDRLDRVRRRWRADDLPRRGEPVDHRCPAGQPVCSAHRSRSCSGHPGGWPARTHRARHGAPHAPRRR